MADIVKDLIELYGSPGGSAGRGGSLRLRRFEDVSGLCAAEFSDHESFFVTVREGMLFIFKPYGGSVPSQKSL